MRCIGIGGTLLVTLGPFFAAETAARHATRTLSDDMIGSLGHVSKVERGQPTSRHKAKASQRPGCAQCHRSVHRADFASARVASPPLSSRRSSPPGHRHRQSLAMFGSCCEEQEAQEAAVRSRIRAATRVSEKRLLGNSLAAARAQSFCKGLCCETVECRGCGEDDAWEEDEANDDPAESDPRMAHNDDDEEAELLRRMRATRLSALHSAAEKAAQPAVGYEYVEERTLLLLQDDPAAPPTVCLVGCEDDTELSAWIDDHLTVRPPLASASQRHATDSPASTNRRPSRRVIQPLDSCGRKSARRFSAGYQ